MLTLVAIRQPEERRLTPGPHTSAGRGGPQLTWWHCRIRHSLIIDFRVMTVLDYTALSLDYGPNRLKYFTAGKCPGVGKWCFQVKLVRSKLLKFGI